MWFNVINKVETDAAASALTFDDGPDPFFTPQVLMILKKHGVIATFFMVGERAQRHPEIVQKVFEEGHSIGNHSWSHANFTARKSTMQIIRQLRRCAKAIAPFGKKFFRPPYGAQDLRVRLVAKSLGYQVILWNVSAQDWTPQGSDLIARKMIERIGPGSIFLLHDGLYKSDESANPAIGRESVLVGLDRALWELKEKFRFVTVSELLRVGRPVCEWPLRMKPIEISHEG